MNQENKYRGCSYCKHFRIDGGCPAFDPDPIPIDIVSGQTKHFDPILGQKNSIVYADCGKSIIQRLIEQENEQPALNS
jgi:O-acetyl-ADP-ribose deacetylase